MTALGTLWGWRDQAKKKKRERTQGHEQPRGDFRGKSGGWRWKSVWGINDNGKIQEIVINKFLKILFIVIMSTYNFLPPKWTICEI